MDFASKGRPLLDYWAILLRRRWIVYVAVCAVALTALIGSFLTTPLYRSTAAILE